jgi:hypothetical protein
MKPKRKQTKPQVSVPKDTELRFEQITKPFKRKFSAMTVALWVRELGTPEERKVAQAKIDSIRAEVGL